MARSKNIGDAIRKKLAEDQDLAEAVGKARLSFNVASEIQRVRDELGVTQKGLANLVGTQQSVIARLEDAEYDGHSVKLLRRIADATGKRLELRFVDAVPQHYLSLETEKPAKQPRKRAAKGRKTIPRLVAAPKASA
jgi:transcriptional regulator with XRE-family HTH domain